MEIIWVDFPGVDFLVQFLKHDTGILFFGKKKSDPKTNFLGWITCLGCCSLGRFPDTVAFSRFVKSEVEDL